MRDNIVIPNFPHFIYIENIKILEEMLRMDIRKVTKRVR